MAFLFENFWTFLLNFSFRSLSMLLATSYAAPDVRKVPPRTPPERLETLMRFSKDYIDANVGTYRNQDKVDGQQAAIQRIHDNLLENYSKINDDGLRKCSYFDPNSEHGGPRPDNTGKRAIKQLWVQKELCALGNYSPFFRSKWPVLSKQPVPSKANQMTIRKYFRGILFVP